LKERGFRELSLQLPKQVNIKLKKYLSYCILCLIIFYYQFQNVYAFSNHIILKNSVTFDPRNNLLLTDFKKSIVKRSMLKLIDFKKNSLKFPGETNNFFNDLEVTYKSGFLREIEEAYSTNSFYQNLKINKVLSDKFRIGFGFLLENAKRKEIDKPDRKRWFDNTTLKTDYDFNDHNTLSLFVSGSISDTTLTSYGASYKSSLQIDKTTFSNYLTLSHDYFYYWNDVAQNYVRDILEIKYSDFNISAGYFFGLVDFNYVDGYQAKAKNPNSQISFDIRYKFLENPLIKIGFNFNTRDYRYYSPLYYSPADRKVSGLYTYLYDTYKSYYIYFGSGAHIDNSNVFIWDIDGELGYFNDKFSMSVGLSRYNDPFYTSYNSFLNVTKSF